MGSYLMQGYKAYTTPLDVQKSVMEEIQLGDVGTSISISVTYSASWSWTFTWGF